MAASDMRRLLAAAVLTVALPAFVQAQSASEVERCFQNPAACASGGGEPPAQATPQAPPRAAGRAAPAPDHTSVLQSPEADRRKIQESLRTLDKYSGPIDGNLQSAATVKAIGDWQKGHGAPATGKLTPPEAKALNDEAARVPIKRIDPASQLATGQPTPLAPSANPNADALKALQARLAERRKAAEPKANAATEALIRDLKAYAAADGKGVAGEQFPDFAKWYAEAKAGNRTIGDMTPAIEDYGDAKAGAAATVEMNLQSKQGDKTLSQCLVFAWIEGNPRKNTQAFSCDDVAAVEKWKTDQALRSAWR
jgi:hypothetical protein